MIMYLLRIQEQSIKKHSIWFLVSYILGKQLVLILILLNWPIMYINIQLDNSNCAGANKKEWYTTET